MVGAAEHDSCGPEQRTAKATMRIARWGIKPARNRAQSFCRQDGNPSAIEDPERDIAILEGEMVMGAPPPSFHTTGSRVGAGGVGRVECEVGA